MRLWSELTGFVIVVLLVYVGATLVATAMGERETGKRLAAEAGKCPASSYNVYEIGCR